MFNSLINEIPPSGGYFSSYLIRTIQIRKIYSNWDYIILIFELILFIQNVWYTYEEYREIIKERSSYLTYFWNYIDIIIIMVKFN